MSIEAAAKKSHLFPIAGLGIGLIVGSASWFFFNIGDPVLAGILTLMTLYFVTGINHIDGLADFSDGIYVIGSREKKFKVMKDKQLGVAGFLVVFFFLLLSLYSYYRLEGFVAAIVVAEVSAKAGMLASIFFGKPGKIGSGDLFMKNMRKDLFPLSIIFSLVVCFALKGIIGLIALLAALAAAIIVIKMAHKDLGCVTGDVFGAVNEISRLVALLVLVMA